MSAFYNENDAYPAQWLRNLVADGHIAPGVVDERSIVDLDPEELRGYTQAHFFAGIGVWSHALRLAGWADGDGVWTGSCPCQPFSAAGKRRGHADERHLWPAWFRLIRECRPRVIFGEQVASKDGLSWLDAVRADMEGAGYAFGAVDLCAAGVGAPHIRQRAFFVAYTEHPTQGWSLSGPRETNRRRASGEPGGTGAACDVGDADNAGPQGRKQRGGGPGELPAGSPGLAGFWSDAEWVWCRDNCWRPHGPESFPLTVAHGATGRVGRLRAYGNAIVAPLAAEFVRAFMEATARLGGSRE